MRSSARAPRAKSKSSKPAGLKRLSKPPTSFHSARSNEHAAADPAVDLRELVAALGVALGRVVDRDVERPCADRLLDPRATAVHAGGRDDVHAVGVDAARVEDDLAHHDTDAVAHLAQREHALEPARRLDRRVAVEAHYDLARGELTRPVERVDDPARGLRHELEAGDAARVAPALEHGHAAIGRAVVDDDQLDTGRCRSCCARAPRGRARAPARCCGSAGSARPRAGRRARHPPQAASGS